MSEVCSVHFELLKRPTFCTLLWSSSEIPRWSELFNNVPVNHVVVLERLTRSQTDSSALTRRAVVLQ